MNTPNIFSIATKELSQDAFITWLIQWADESYQENDRNGLHIVGKNFVKFLLGMFIDSSNIEIKAVDAGRQWDGIDIWADINSKYFIIIEDKTNTSEHDNQLARYSSLVENAYSGKREMIRIYIKTELESLNKIEEIKKKGWAYCSRQDLLEFLMSQSCKDNIFTDYVNFLKEKEEESNSFDEYKNLNCWDAVKGLFVDIQKYLRNEDEWSDWGYVPNPSGGFLGLWFHFVACASNMNSEFYLQIENNCNGKCDLFIKINGNWVPHDISYLYEKLEYLQSHCRSFGLTVSKPSRYKIGEYTSLAIINDVFIDSNGKLNLDNLFSKIESAKKLVDNLANNS